VFSPNSPPESLCLLRTSALGDVTHVVPLVRTLQQLLPQTRLTWIVGKLEQRLVGDIGGVEYIVFDKGKGLSAYRQVRRHLAGADDFASLMAFLQSLANLYLPTLMADIVDKGIVTGDNDYILRTGGLMLLITNALMLWLTSRIATTLDLGFHVQGFWTTILGALVISIAGMVIEGILPDRDRARR